MNYLEFSSNIKQKYPQYQDMNDEELAKKMVAKFPQYSDVTFDQSYSVGGFAKNIGNQLMEAPGAVVNAVKGGISLLNAPPAQVGQVLKEFSPVLPDKNSPIGVRPGAVYSGIVKDYSHPLQRAYEKPLSTALDVASFVLPAMKGTKTGSTVGEAASMATKPIRSILGASGDLIAGGTKKLASSIFGPTEEAISERILRNEAIGSAAGKNTAKLSGDVEKGYGEVMGQIRSLEKQARDVLRTSPFLEEGAIPKDDILKTIQNARDRIGFTVTPNEEYTKKILDNLTENMKMLRNTVSESQQRDLIQKVSGSIDFGRREYGQADLSLMEIRKKLSDQLKRNSAYKQIMKKEESRMRLKNELEDKFGITRSVGEGMVASDTTASKLNSILQEPKQVASQPILRKLKGATGRDILQGVEDYKVAQQFEPGMTRPNGSRRVNIGGAVGSGVGGMVGGFPGMGIGGIAGVLTGSILDKQGGAMLAKIIDGYVAAKKSIPNLTLNEYLPMAIKGLNENKVNGTGVLDSFGSAAPSFASVGSASESNKKELTIEKAKEFLKQANGDKELARKLARESGFSF
jgi:hypothetical protein